MFQFVATIQRNPTNTNDDDDLLRSPFEDILKLGNNPISRSTEQKPKEETYQKLDFTNNAYKAPVRSTNPFHDDVQKPSSPTNVPQQPSPPSRQESATVSDEQYWKNTEEYHSKYSQIFFFYLFIF